MKEGVAAVDRVLPALRLSAGLVSLTLSVLVTAAALGLVPERRSAVREGRRALCEALAIQCSLAVQRRDIPMIRETLNAVAARNPDILSSAVRGPDGVLLVDTGDHQRHWAPQAGECSTDTHIQVPIALHDKLWGTIEISFPPPVSAGRGPLPMSPLLRLLLFMASVAFLAFFLYLWLTFRALGFRHADAIPQRIRDTFDTLTEGVLILDRHQRIALANKAFARLAHRSPEELQGRKVCELPWGEPQTEEPGHDYPWDEVLRQGTPRTGTLVSFQADETDPRTLSVNSTPIVGNDGTYRGALATFDDLSPIERKNAHLRKLLQRLKQSRAQVRRQNHELKVLATRDPLTGCLNRRSFFAEFETHWAGATRYGYPLSCVMVDVDHFKAINDRHGHSTGDQVLQHVAGVLRSLASKSDLVCRYGGEEFCILMPNVGIDAAMEAAERLRQGIASTSISNISVTASLGVSALTLGAREPHALLDQADKALYLAKQRGRNRVVRWDEAASGAGDGAVTTRVVPAREDPVDVPIPFHAVTVLVSALAHRNLDTAEHSQRVAEHCAALASGLMSQSECYILEVAALLHDIGKLGVSDAILLKPGPLTEAEWEVIRTHEGIGVDIITAAFTSTALIDIIRNHHSWYGGSPHDPELPTGTAIPLGARILAIADAYDAIVSDRVYRKGRSPEDAFAELRRCAGIQFDPELVERFIATVQGRDDCRSVPQLHVSKQLALRIGLHIERLACAVDARDIPTLRAMAGYLRATTAEHEITPIANLAGELEQAAASPSDWIELVQLTVNLLDLCRSTYGSYILGCGLGELGQGGVRTGEAAAEPIICQLAP
jgi:diguanylate cyclase (GGDEF)-like protein/putative nucleotidyltransferase with HDIG domain